MTSSNTELGAFAYPGFRYLAGSQREILPNGCSPRSECEDLDRRVVEALPWLAFAFVNLDWDWLVTNAKIRDRQNRLGFVVELAKETAARKGDVVRSAKLSEKLSLLRRSRLVEKTRSVTT